MSGKKIDVNNVESITYSHHSTDQVLKHKHENFEIVYYLDGKGLSTVYGETIYNFNYIADSLLIIPPEVYHGEYAKEETQIICNQLSLPIEYSEKALFYKKTAKNADIFDKIKSQMIEINRLWFDMYTKKTDHAAKINELILHLSINVFNLITKGKKNRGEYKAEITSVVKDYIRRYAFNKINYDILAEEFGYSSDRFRHIFVEETGMTLYAYQQGLRFDYAKRKLLLSDTKILDIAQKCGYSNSIRFCEWFSNMAGMSPRKYRSMNDNFEWGVVLNSNDVKRRNRISVLLDIDSASGDSGVSLALAYVMHKKEYVELFGATVIGNGEETGKEQNGFASFYKSEGVSVGTGTKEATDLLKEKLLAADRQVTMVF
ncbi:MAG: helix-turn-helix transcriptional regulator, partial [Candidatus Scatosoma sp.]